MSRTFAVNNSNRKSRRLRENGYYHVPGDNSSFWPDGPPSDEDDTTSIDSNLSKVSLQSEQRLIGYKESPTKLHPSYRRRKNTASPRFKQTMQREHAISREVVELQQASFTSRSRRKTQISKTTSTTNVLAQDNHTAPIVGTISATSVSSSRRKLPRRGYVVNQLFGMDEDNGTNNHQSSIPADIEPANLIRQRVLQGEQNLFSAIGDGVDKVTAPEKTQNEQFGSHAAHEKNVLKTSVESKSYSSDEEVITATSSHETRVSSSQAPLFQEENVATRILVSMAKALHIFSSYFIAIFWNAGRLLYQTVTKILVFDTWVLSRSIQVERNKMKKLFLFLLVAILGFIFLYFFPLRLLKPDDAPASAASTPSFTTLFRTSNPTPQYTADHKHTEVMHESLQKLEVQIRKMEELIRANHSYVLNRITLLQSNYGTHVHDNNENQKNVLSALEDRIQKQFSSELLKNNDLLQDKLHNMQLELNRVREDHTEAARFLRQEIIATAEKGKAASPELLDKLNKFEKLLSSFDEKVAVLSKDQSVLEARLETRANNVTFIKAISNEQFVENFLFLLEKGSSNDGIPGSEGTTKDRRYQQLAVAFLEWLRKRELVQKHDLEKMKEEVIKNHTLVEQGFKRDLQKSVLMLKRDLKTQSRSRITINHVTSTAVASSNVSEALIKSWIQEALDLYSADRVALPDFALESAGGSVVNTRCSESFQHSTALVSILGFPIYYDINTPRSIIQPSSMPGECWAFKGSSGFAVISLSQKVVPTAFTLDHIPKAVALNSNISSAPKGFSVYGLDYANDAEGTLLGSFTYEEAGPAIQHFKRVGDYNADDAFSYIELRITSNWGHPDFTCVYRFRVHGKKSD